MLADYQVAREMGMKARALPPEQRSQVLDQLAAHVASSKNLSEAPILRDIPGAARDIRRQKRTWIDKLPSFMRVHEGYKPSLPEKILPYAAAAGVVNAAPHAALHFGLNTARKLTAVSPLGKKFMGSAFSQGLGGKPLRKTTENVWDYLVSPAALDTRRIGGALAQEIKQKPEQAATLLGGARAVLDPALKAAPQMKLPPQVPVALSTARKYVSTAARNLPLRQGLWNQLRTQGSRAASRLFGV